MDRTSILRGVLRVGALFNFGAAAMLAFPTTLGQVAELPPPGSRFYPWMLAMLVGLFGGVYLWLAQRPRIDRPLVAVAGLGKLGVFAVSTACWQVGEIPGRAMVPAVGDLLFGLVFLGWLAGEVRRPAAGATDSRESARPEPP